MSKFCEGYGTNGGKSFRAKFDDPFLLPSAEYIPETMHEAMDFCRYLYLNNPEYRNASQRVTRHFIQDYKIETDSDEERAELKDFLDYNLKLRLAMMEMGDDWACFAPGTKVTTDSGVFNIEELTGKTVSILSKDGKFRDASFKSYGIQPLMEVTLSDDRKIYATPEHKWPVNADGEDTTLLTNQLKPGHRLYRTVAPRPNRNDDYSEGVRHGFVFVCGATDTDNTTSAVFCGNRKKDILPFFKDYGHIKSYYNDSELMCISGLNANYKFLPDAKKSREYWYGFVTGLLATNEDFGLNGSATITQASKYTLERIVEQLPRIGMCAGAVTSRTGDIQIGDCSYNDHTVWEVDLLKHFMLPEDFIITHQKVEFEKHLNKGTNNSKTIRIKSVTNTGTKSEVFCCVEMETHTIVVDNGVLSNQCYGNAYYRVHFPFKRLIYRTDKNNKKIWYDINAFSIDDIKFNLKELKYNVVDPKTKKREDFDFVDVKQKNKDNITLVKYDPRLIDVIAAHDTNKVRYLYRLPDSLVADVQSGNIFQINNLSRKRLLAIRDNKNLLFSENEIFHFRAPTISGIGHGYGLPEIIANFRLLYQLQVYKKIDEQVALDYMLPFRILSLDSTGSGNEAAQKMDAVEWKKQLQHIIKTRRKDKTAMFAVPAPIKYQEEGGQGKMLAPKDLIEYQTNNMLNAMGYPAELYTMSLNVESIPSTIRLFEQTFWFIHENYNNFCRWVVSRINTYLNNQRVDVSIKPPSMADDIEKQNLMLQLVAQGEVSRKHVFNWLGIDDPVAEFKDRQQEDARFAEIQEEVQRQLQKKMESQQSLMAASDQGIEANAEAGGTTPMDVEERAQAKAQEWLSIPDDGDRRQAMNATRAQDYELYALAKQIMEELRSEGASDGRQQVNQAAQQQPPM